MISGRIQVNHSYDMLMRAQARYDYQLSHVNNIGAHVQTDLMSRERALLASLRDKLAQARSAHKKLLEEELSSLSD